MWYSAVRFLVTLTLSLLAAPLAADAQHAEKIPHVGVLFSASSSEPPLASLEVFQQALRDLGYIEGQTIALEWRWADQRLERLLDLAGELVHLNVDVIVAVSHPAIEAARRTTTTIPIVMSAVGDPVQAGFVKSIAHPGGNITGVNAIAVELVEKQLELLKEAVPGIPRIAVLGPPGVLARHGRALQRAAQALGVHVQSLEVSPSAVDTLLSDEIARVLGAATREGAGALVILPYVLFVANERRIADLAAQNRLPAIFWRRGFAEVGGFMSYGASLHDLYQRIAYYVDRILKGAKPADLPVEHPTKFELVINLKTANDLGLTIPPTLLFQADKVIR